MLDITTLVMLSFHQYENNMPRLGLVEELHVFNSPDLFFDRKTS